MTHLTIIFDEMQTLNLWIKNNILILIFKMFWILVEINLFNFTTFLNKGWIIKSNASILSVILNLAVGLGWGICNWGTIDTLEGYIASLINCNWCWIIWLFIYCLRWRYSSNRGSLVGLTIPSGRNHSSTNWSTNLRSSHYCLHICWCLRNWDSGRCLAIFD